MTCMWMRFVSPGVGCVRASPRCSTWGERGALHGKSPALWVDGHQFVNLQLFSSIDQTCSFGLNSCHSCHLLRVFCLKAEVAVPQAELQAGLNVLVNLARCCSVRRVLPLCSLNPLSSSTTQDTGGPKVSAKMFLSAGRWVSSQPASTAVPGGQGHLSQPWHCLWGKEVASVLSGWPR